MSSLFYANPCKLDVDLLVGQVAWSNVDPIAAVSASTVEDDRDTNNQVLFINNEGGIIPNHNIFHDREVTAMCWQPNGRVLAVGWGDGMISCWNADGRLRPTSSYSNNSNHSTAITMMKWNPMGRRLITGDKRGQVCVWTADSRGVLTPSRQYRKKGEITTAVFCVLPARTEAQRKAEMKQSYSPAFFFGTDKGNLVYADDLGHCTDVQQLSASIDTMLFFEERSRLVIITRAFLLTQYQVADDGRVSRVMQVKMSIAGDVEKKGLKSVIWASPGLLAAASQEKMVRLLDIAADESYNLSLSACGDILDRSDRVSTVSFGPLDRYLAVGTEMGLVAVWKYNGPLRDVSGARSTVMSTSASDWELHYKTTLSSPVHQLSWSGGQGTLAVVTDEGVVVLTETIMRCNMTRGLAVVQISSHEVSLNVTGTPNIWVENTGLLVQGLSVGKGCFAVWSGKEARVYRVDTQLNNIDALEPFLTAARSMAIADVEDEALFVAEQSLVRILNYAGVMKASISFTEAEGQPEHLDINGTFLAVITNKGIIKVFDIRNPTKPKPDKAAGKFYESSTSVSTGGSGGSASNLKVRCIKVNSTGTRVAILADNVEGVLQVRHPDTRLHVFDRNRGGVSTYDFTKDKKYPLSIFWDEEDDRILGVEAQRSRSLAVVRSTSSNSGSGGGGSSSLSPATDSSKSGGQTDKDTVEKEAAEQDNEVEVVIFFATTENGLLMQDSFSRKPPYGSMLGVVVPRLYFKNAPSPGENVDDTKLKVYSKVMRDFIGMDNVDAATKSALLDFSYNVTLGKLDEAYRAVKKIGSASIWENMAHMCVKTKRLDVAEVCLGNMGHARGAAAVRESKKDGNVDVSIGILAVHLGLLDDAARLFRDANRYDLLNKLYQSAGIWDKAARIARTQDRIHLKNTFYQYAKHLESIGEIDAAIDTYEKSENGRIEIPRMLFTLGKMDELEDYVQRSSDPVLLKWWAAYLESTERFDKARKYYSKAGDQLSLVRICCFKGDFAKAADLVHESGDRAAAYHLARQLENQGEFQEAINYYADAGCYNHSIRLTRAYNLEAELMRFALKATPALMIECAVHFEERGELEKAVQLYHKGGDLPRALDLCFRAGEQGGKNAQAKGVFDMLNSIAQDLGADTSPQTLARCAEFLVKHKQFEKAIELYVMAKRFNQAVEMCLQHKVTINDDMVEKLTPPETMDPTERKDILKDLARALKKQGSFTLASKKFTQAGDRVRAIKCLVRSGDTKAVIQFATISRNAEIYTLAANYLQQMNWRESIDIMKAIVGFYTKAKAFEQLAGFYDSCAQVEIDDYRDYEKAIGALKEAMKYLQKATSTHASDLSESIDKRVQLMEKFVQARRAAQRDPDTMVAICEELLREPMLEEALRAGDCLAMLIEYFHKSGKMREAYTYVQEMEERRIALHPYVDAAILEEIFQAVGASARGGGRGRGGGGGAEPGSGAGPAESKVVDEDDEPFRGGDSKAADGGGGGPGRSSSAHNSGKGGGGGGGRRREEVEEEEEEVLDEDIQEEVQDEVEEDVGSRSRGGRNGPGAGRPRDGRK